MLIVNASVHETNVYTIFHFYQEILDCPKNIVTWV